MFFQCLISDFVNSVEKKACKRPTLMIDRGNMLTHAFPVDYTNKKYFSTETGFGTGLDDNTAFQTFVIS